MTDEPEVNIPDVAEPLRGFRYFRWSGMYPRSITMTTPWLDGQIQAQCLAFGGSYYAPEWCPGVPLDEHRDHGIYAYKHKPESPNYAGRLDIHTWDMISAEVLLWGWVWPHAPFGASPGIYRAQFGRIVKINVQTAYRTLHSSTTIHGSDVFRRSIGARRQAVRWARHHGITVEVERVHEPDMPYREGLSQTWLDHDNDLPVPISPRMVSFRHHGPGDYTTRDGRFSIYQKNGLWRVTYGSEIVVQGLRQQAKAKAVIAAHPDYLGNR